jgi:hypothetical protein
MPVDVWSKKDERQYRAIYASCLASDARKKKACKRVAAATVNKQRCLEGRAKVCSLSTFKPRRKRRKARS